MNNLRLPSFTLLSSLLLSACFWSPSYAGPGGTYGPPRQWEQSPQPGSHTALDQAVERELTRLFPQLWTAAYQSVVDTAVSEQSMVSIAHEVQHAVNLQMTFPDALGRVQRAVAQLRRSGAGQQMARQAQYGQDVTRRSAQLLASHPGMRAPGQPSDAFQRATRPMPELAGELAREQESIARVASLQTGAATKAEGEREKAELVQRIYERVSDRFGRQVVELQVNLAIAQVQMREIMTPDGRIAGLPKYRVPPNNDNAQRAFDRMQNLEKVDLAQLPGLFVDAYRGDVEPALHFLRAEFARQENILTAWPWPRGTSDPSRTSFDRSDLQYSVDTLLSLAQQNRGHAGLTQLAYETLLAYRTRVPEVERRISAALAEAGTSEVLRVRTELRGLREQIAAIELRRANAVAISEADQQNLLAAQRREREAAGRADQLAQLARVKDRPFEAGPGLARIRGSLTPQQAVISFVEFRQVRPDNINDPSTWPRWYGAFVLTHDQLTWVPLEAATTLEPSIDALLRAVTNAKEPLARKHDLAHAVFGRAFAPLSKLVQDKQELVVVADGMLQLVPMQLLRDDKGWLAEQFRIRYVITERQLDGEYGPKVMAGPPRIIVGGPYAEHPRPLQVGEALSTNNFSRLSNLDSEAQAVKARLPGAVLIRESSATDDALEGPAPSVLHVAAHGIYLPLDSTRIEDDRGLALSSTAQSAREHPITPSQYRAPVEDSAALTKSALVFAPSSKPHSDGFLTAYEIATHNLWGTELVVLSACETGRGLVDRVLGVRGLRSAFFIAGANSLVLSMWSVDDHVTAEFMRTFYDELGQGVGRADALARASDSVRVKYADPYLWAPFILLGDSGPLPPRVR